MSSTNDFINAIQDMAVAVSKRLYITGLSDTPSGYQGHSGDYLVVNDGETGIHFTGIEKIAADLTDYGFGGGSSTIPSYTDLPDVTENDGKIVASGCDLYHSCNGTWNKIGGESIPAPDEAPGCVTNLEEYNQYQEYKDVFLADNLGNTFDQMLNSNNDISNLIFDVCLFPESSLEEEKNTVIIDETTYKWGMFASPQTINVSAQGYSDGQGNDCVFSEWTSSNANFGDSSSANTTVFVDTDLSITGSFECLVAPSQPSCEDVALHVQPTAGEDIADKSSNEHAITIANDIQETFVGLLPSPPSNFALFGHSIDRSGDTLAIGARDSNAVHIYDILSDGSYSFNQTILGGSYGHGCAFYNNELYLTDYNNSKIVAYVKQGDGTWVYSRDIASPPPGYENGFAIDVSISEDWMAVGQFICCSKDKENVHIYKKQLDGSWVHSSVIERPSDAIVHSRGDSNFGTKIALHNDTLMVCASYDGGSYTGRVYIYNRQSDDTWTRIQMLQGERANDLFGTSIDCDDDLLVINAHNGNNNGCNNCGTGKTYIYKKQNDGMWVLSYKFNGQGYPWGRDVNLTGSTLLIARNSSNKVYEYEINTQTGATVDDTATLFSDHTMNFDGDDSLTIGDTNTFKFLHDKTTQWTIEFWIKDSGSSTLGTFFSTAHFTTQVGLRFKYQNSKKPALHICNGTTTRSFDQAIQSDISENQWYHIALCYDGVNITCYLNGTTEFQAQWTGTAASENSSYALNIARNPGNSDFDYFLGQIQDFRISKKAVYTGNFTPPTNLLANLCPEQPSCEDVALHLQPAAGETIADKSSNQHTVTTVGDTVADNTATLFGGGTMNFDGNGDYLTVNQTSTLNLGGDFTMEGWFKINTEKWSDESEMLITSWQNDSNNTSGSEKWQLIRTNSQNHASGHPGGKAYFLAWSNTGPILVVSNDSMQLGTWYHVAIVADGDVVSLYLNGKFQNSTTGWNNVTYTQLRPMLVGTRHMPRTDINQPYYTDMHVQDVRISKKAVYKSNFTPPTNLLDNPC